MSWESSSKLTVIVSLYLSSEDTSFQVGLMWTLVTKNEYGPNDLHFADEILKILTMSVCMWRWTDNRQWSETKKRNVVFCCEQVAIYDWGEWEWFDWIKFFFSEDIEESLESQNEILVQEMPLEGMVKVWVVIWQIF